MVTTLGTELGTILGTELGSLVYGFDTRLLYALSNFSAANFYQTLVGGGEVGSPGGFGAVVLLRRTGPLATSTPFMVGSNSNNGHAFYTDTSGYRWRTANGSAVFGYTAPSWTSPASDINCLDVHVGAYKPSSGLLQLWCSRDLRGSIAQTGYTAATAAAVIGCLAGNAFPGEIVGILTYRGEASDTQLRALYDLVRTLWDLPPVFPQGSATDEDILAMSPPLFLDGDTYGASGGNLVTLTNRGTLGGEFTPIGTVSEPAADAAFNGAKVIAFGGAQWLQSALPPSAYRFLHSLYDLFVVFRSAVSHTGVLVSTRTSGIGVQAFVSTTSVRQRAYNGTTYVFDTTQVNAAPVGTTTYVEAALGTSTWSAWNGSQVNSTAPNAASAASGVDPTGTLFIGANPDGSAPLDGKIACIIGFSQPCSESQRQRVRDFIRTKYGVEVITTTHRWSLRDVLRGLDLPVTDGQTAPANLPDTVTAATIDRMDRQGSPTVKIIDPSVDGRKTYGALGFSATAYLVSAAALVTGPTVDVTVTLTLWSLAATQMVCSNASGATGFGLFVFPANSLSIYSYAPDTSVVTVALSAADVGVERTWRVTYDGTTWRLYKDGVLAGSAAAAYAPSSGPMFVGRHPTLTNASLTAGSVSRLTVAGQHDYNITADVIANGGPANGIPLQVLDRIGTDHLTRVGGLQVNSAGGIAGLTKWAPNCIAATRAGGGLAGVGTGFFRAFDLILGPYTTTNGIFGKSDGGNNGDYFRITTSGLQWVVGDGGAVARSAILPLVAGDVTTRQRCVIQHDGANIRIYLGTTSNTISVACAGHTPYAAGSMSLGDILPNGASAQGTSTIYGIQSGNAILTAGEISALLADATFLPVAGKTTYRVWIPDDVAEAGGKVPAVLKERISGTDNMVITGAPLQVAQRVERLWSYEAA